MKRLAILLVLLATSAGADVVTRPPGAVLSGALACTPLSCTLTAPLLAPTGCSPITYSFNGDTDTGMCESAADTISFYTRGFERAKIEGGVGVDQVTLGVLFLRAQGNAANPGFAWTAEASTGLYHTVGNLHFSVQGVERVDFTPSQAWFKVPIQAEEGTWGYKQKSLTDGAAATTFMQIAGMQPNDTAGGELLCTANSNDGTDYRAVEEKIRFVAALKGTAATTAVATVGADLAVSSNGNALTCTWSAAGIVAGLQLQVTCTDDTAGSQTILMRCKYDMTKFPSGATVTYP